MSIVTKSWAEIRQIHENFLANEADFNVTIENARLLIGNVGALFEPEQNRIRGGYLSFQPDLSMDYVVTGPEGRFCGYIKGISSVTGLEIDGLSYNDETERTDPHFSLQIIGVDINTSPQHIYCADSLDWGATEPNYDDYDVRIIGEDALGMHAVSQSSSVVVGLPTLAWWTNPGYLFFRTNIPIFDSYQHAMSYINTGSKVGCINIEGETPYVASTAGKRYFYDMTLYETATGSYDDGVEVLKQSFEIYSTTGWVLAGYCNNPAPYNVRFIAETSPQGHDHREFKFKDRYGHVTVLSGLTELNNKHWAFADANNLIYDEVHDKYYYTNVYTNITMRNTRAEAMRVVDKVEDEDYSVCTRTNRTGTNIDYQKNQDIDFDSAMVGIWCTDYIGTTMLAGALYSTDTSVTDAIKQGLTLMGDNPIDCICSLYYSPIDIGPFTTKISAGLKFGNYTVNYQYNTCKGRKIVELCNVFINETFGNFLDYSNMSMQLYLPFVGLFDIDVALFLNRTMRIECTLDLYNATIKYWVYADEKLVTDRSANFGCQMQITGNDQVGRAREAVQGINAVENDVITAVGGLAGGALTGNPLLLAAGGASASKLIANGALAATPAALAFNNKGRTMKSGTTSSGVSCNDILYPFLLIDIQDAIIPPQLYSVYGMPCNFVGKLGSCSGWTECYDVQLKGGMLPEEKDEILQKLSKGVII